MRVHLVRHGNNTPSGVVADDSDTDFVWVSYSNDNLIERVPFDQTPWVRTYCPVSIVARAGMQTTLLQWARSYLIPSAASRSTTGVRA